MDLEGITLSEISQTKTNTLCCHSYVEPENKINESIRQNRNRLTEIQNKLVVSSGAREEGRRGNMGVED